jgi:hypothetical protein
MKDFESTKLLLCCFEVALHSVEIIIFLEESDGQQLLAVSFVADASFSLKSVAESIVSQDSDCLIVLLVKNEIAPKVHDKLSLNWKLDYSDVFVRVDLSFIFRLKLPTPFSLFHWVFFLLFNLLDATFLLLFDLFQGLESSILLCNFYLVHFVGAFGFRNVQKPSRLLLRHNLCRFLQF